MRGFLSFLLLGFPALLLALAAACSDRVPLPPTPTPSESPEPPATAATPAVSASPTATPRLPEGAELAPIGFGPGIDLPKDVALILEMGCWQCDGPTTGFMRVYRDSGGSVRTDTLLSIETLQLPVSFDETLKGPQKHEPWITSFAVNQDTSEMVVGVCTRGSCAGGMSAPSPSGELTLFRSTDGGVTWGDYGALTGDVFISGGIRNGEIMVARYLQEPPATVPPGGTPPPPKAPEYSFYPSGEAIPTPAGADGYWLPVVLPGGDVSWLTHDGRLVDAAGAQIAATGGSFGYLPRVYAAPGGIALEWGYEEVERNYFAVFDAGGRTRRVYRFPEFLLPGPWIDDLRLFGNTGVGSAQLTTPVPSLFVGYLPALVDLNERLVHPIVRPFLDPGAPRGRNHVVAIQRGTLLRVVNTGSCLNVRAGPNAAAAVLDCVADGVLLRQGVGNGQCPFGVFAADGVTWYSVITPAGAEGFASGEYLEAEPLSCPPALLPSAR